MKKILFLHGFFATGQCVPALALREAFNGRAEVISPDLSTHPKEALTQGSAPCAVCPQRCFLKRCEGMVKDGKTGIGYDVPLYREREARGSRGSTYVARRPRPT